MCVLCHESVDTLGRGTVQGLFCVKEVCKLILENEPHDYGSRDIAQILQSSVKRKPKWHRQCYQHLTNQIKLERLLLYQPLEYVSEKESQVKRAFKCQDKCLFSGKHLSNHLF